MNDQDKKAFGHNDQKEWIEYVEKVSNKKGVKKIAVENFLMSLDKDYSYQDTKANLYNDSQSYKWNYKTIETIGKGINLFYYSGNP